MAHTSSIDLTGQRFGRLVVQCFTEETSYKSQHAFWIALCDCGNAVMTSGVYLTRGLSKSCGCLRGHQTPAVRQLMTTRAMASRMGISEDEYCRVRQASIELVNSGATAHDIAAALRIKTNTARNMLRFARSELKIAAVIASGDLASLAEVAIEVGMTSAQALKVVRGVASVPQRRITADLDADAGGCCADAEADLMKLFDLEDGGGL